jgi:hypothetical protein
VDRGAETFAAYQEQCREFVRAAVIRGFQTTKQRFRTFLNCETCHPAPQGVMPPTNEGAGPATLPPPLPCPTDEDPKIPLQHYAPDEQFFACVEEMSEWKVEWETETIVF